MNAKAELEAWKAVKRLESIQTARAQVARWTAERDAATSHLEMWKLKLLLAERESKTGEQQMPMNAEAARRYFNKEN